MENKRESNFELLRIVSMILIVSHHFAVHSGFKLDENVLMVNKIWIWLLNLGGKVGVDLFVLISGYFLVKAKEIKISKILRIIIQVAFYSVIFYLLSVEIGIIKFKTSEFISNFFATEVFPKYWFVSTYFILYILSPYINVLLNNLKKENYIKMLAIMTICWSIFPTVTGSLFEYSRLIWFIYLYSVAGYIRMYGNEIKIENKKIVKLIVAIPIIMILFTVLFNILSVKMPVFKEFETYYYGMEKTPILIISILVFLLTKNISIKHNKIINLISSATFGVYLIHDNMYNKFLIWKVLFDSKSFQNNSMFIVYSIYTIIVVYIYCTIAELIRINIVEKTYIKKLEKASEKISQFETSLAKKQKILKDKNE